MEEHSRWMGFSDSDDYSDLEDFDISSSPLKVIKDLRNEGLKKNKKTCMKSVVHDVSGSVSRHKNGAVNENTGHLGRGARPKTTKSPSLSLNSSVQFIGDLTRNVFNDNECHVQSYKKSTNTTKKNGMNFNVDDDVKEGSVSDSSILLNPKNKSKNINGSLNFSHCSDINEGASSSGYSYNKKANVQSFSHSLSLLPLFDSDSDLEMHLDTKNGNGESPSSNEDEWERKTLKVIKKHKRSEKRPVKRKRHEKLDRVSRAFSKTNLSDNQFASSSHTLTAEEAQSDHALASSHDFTSFLTQKSPLPMRNGHVSRSKTRKHNRSINHSLASDSDDKYTHKKRSKEFRNGRSHRHGTKRPRDSSEDAASGPLNISSPVHCPVPVTMANQHSHHARKSRSRPRSQPVVDELSTSVLIASSSESVEVPFITPPHRRSPTASRSRQQRRSRSSGHRTRDSLGFGASSFTPETLENINRFQQLEDDEEMARRLQEEMDHEFAQTLEAQGSTPCSGCGRVHGPDEDHGIRHQGRIRGSPRSRRSLNRFIHGRDVSLSSSMDELESAFAMIRAPEEFLMSPQHLARRHARRSRGRRIPRNVGMAFSIVDVHREIGDDYENLLALGEMLGDAMPRGLDKSAINQLPTHKFDKTMVRSQECAICMSEFVTGENLRILPCFHDFHSKCIDQWLQTNATCPICRVAVKLN